MTIDGGMDWEEQCDVNKAEELLEKGLEEEEPDEEAAATYLRGQMTYAIARVCWATLREYNLTLGVNTQAWINVAKESQVMMVSIVHGIISEALRHPMDVHGFTVRFLRSAGVEDSLPDMQPWSKLSDDQKRKPMIVFGLVVALLADPEMFARAG